MSNLNAWNTLFQNSSNLGRIARIIIGHLPEEFNTLCVGIDKGPPAWYNWTNHQLIEVWESFIVAGQVLDE